MALQVLQAEIVNQDEDSALVTAAANVIKAYEKVCKVIAQKAAAAAPQFAVDDKNPTIHAAVYSDDHVFHERFDALPFFQSATVEEIVSLAKCGWEGDYAADAVAHFMESKGHAGVRGVLDYATLKDGCGFECRVDVDDALHWLYNERPDVIGPIAYCGTVKNCIYDAARDERQKAIKIGDDANPTIKASCDKPNGEEAYQFDALPFIKFADPDLIVALARGGWKNCPASNAVAQLMAENGHLGLSSVMARSRDLTSAIDPDDSLKWLKANRTAVYNTVLLDGDSLDWLRRNRPNLLRATTETMDISTASAIFKAFKTPITDGGLLREPFIIFGIGTPREKVWQWLETSCPGFVVGEAMVSSGQQLGNITSGKPLLITEGFATAASLHKATGLPRGPGGTR